MIYGQIINFMMPIILPWTFMMLEGGIRNFQAKINVASYLVLYFLGIFFPIYYFFELLQERESKLIKERNKRVQQKLKEIKDLEKQKSELEQKKVEKVNDKSVEKSKLNRIEKIFLQ